MLYYFRLIPITLISSCLLPLASVVLGQCPYQGWTVSGSCQMTGYCVDPREQCYSSSVCCRISSQQYAQTTKQNPKTGAFETNYCPLGSYRDGGCSTWCWTPSQVCVNRQDCCVKSNIPVNNNNNNNSPYNPGTNPNAPGYNPNNNGYNPYSNNGYNPYNPGTSGGTCRQGLCPLTMCQDGTCSLTRFCYDQNDSCLNGVCCSKANSYNPYTNNNNNNPSAYYPANQYNNNPASGYNYPTNGYDKPDPTIIVINTSPTGSTAYSNPAYLYSSNNLYNGYNPSNNNGYNPYNNGYNPYSNGNNPYNNNRYNQYSNGYNPYSNGNNPYSNNGYNPYSNNGYNPNNNGYNPYSNNGYNPNNNGYNPYSNNGYNPNNNGYNPYSNNGYNPNNNGYNPYSNNGYNPNNNGYNQFSNNVPYNNGNNPYSNAYNYNNYDDCSTGSMVPDQSACNSMQGQCSNPMVAQTCRQMCCSTQFAGVGGAAYPQISGR